MEDGEEVIQECTVDTVEDILEWEDMEAVMEVDIQWVEVMEAVLGVATQVPDLEDIAALTTDTLDDNCLILDLS